MRYRREGGGRVAGLIWRAWMVVWSMLQGRGLPRSHSLPLFLNEKTARAAGGTKRVVVLWGHVVCISEDRVSGTRIECGWCRGSLGCMRLRGYRTFGLQIWERVWDSTMRKTRTHISIFRCIWCIYIYSCTCVNTNTQTNCARTFHSLTWILLPLILICSLCVFNIHARILNPNFNHWALR